MEKPRGKREGFGMSTVSETEHILSILLLHTSKTVTILHCTFRPVLDFD